MVVAKKLSDPSAQNEQLPLLIQGNIATIKTITENAGGSFKYFAGDIASVVVPVKNIHLFFENKSITRIEGNNARLKLLNDSVRVNNNVNEVHIGLTPLPKGYDGDSVVIGIIDSGIDFLHPDFRDSVGGKSVTRIKYLWDQTMSTGGTTPQPFNYGQEWNNLQIDSGNASGHGDGTGHGTHVTGVATGNGKGANVNKGVAPAADMIIVEANFNNPTGLMISDAVQYIYSKAQTLGKPCVINISVGDYYGSHDGNNLEAQLIKNLITQQNGRSLVAAAGNLGNIPFHLGYQVTSDTSFTWFKPDPSMSGKIYIQVWGDTNNLKNVYFAVGADRVTPNYLFKGNTSFFQIPGNLGVLQYDTLKSGSDRIGTIIKYADIQAGTYSLEIEITPDSSLFNWRLMATGSGHLDVWNLNFSNYQSGMVTSGLPSSSIMPDSMFYKYPDMTQNMVSSFQCLDEVITVANYYNRNTHLNCDSNIYVDGSITPGTIAPNSSKGPTRDGRIKPDVASTGNYTMSTGPAWLMAAVIGGAACTTHVSFGNLHFRDGGTSNASPAVAGIAALYLQRYPTASYSAVKNAIIYCAKQDAFTGPFVPNTTWGYGKANAFAALQNCYIGIDDEKINSARVMVYPNPFAQTATIKYQINNPQIKNAQLVIYNTIGSEVKTITLSNSSGEITINRNDMINGIYFYSLVSEKQTLAAGKIVVW